MASRLLLTLLALLTGLAAQGSPAQARGCVADRAVIGVLASAQAVQERRAIAVRAVQPARTQLPDDAEGSLDDLGNPAPLVPAVLTGIDRARE